MKRNSVLISLLFLLMNFTNAQTTIPLWDTESTTSDPSKSEAQIITYLPNKDINKKIAVIICPGGGYGGLAIDHEGHQFAKWLQSNGIAGIILQYRLPHKQKEVPMEDFNQAISYVRSKAIDWDLVDDNMKSKIGVAGFSAGGHLASTASTHFSSQENRPDFSILFYPVITMGQYTHEGSRNNLLGDTRTANDILLYSNENQADEQTPPAILLLSDDDRAVLPINSIMYYKSLKEYNIPASMYIFPEGGHGWGMRENFKYHKEMLSLLKSWLDDLSKKDIKQD